MASVNLLFLVLCIFCVNLSRCKNLLNEVWNVDRISELEKTVRYAACLRYTAHGHNWEQWYEINNFVLDNTIIIREGDDLKDLIMIISIKGLRDGLILLSPKKNPSTSDHVFEISVGAANNKLTILRTSTDGKSNVKIIDTPNILTDQYYTHFKILIHENTMVFGILGQDPIFTHNDESFKTIKYLSLASWDDLDVKFLYDCSNLRTIKF